MRDSRNFTVIILSLGAIFSLAPLSIDMYLPALPGMANEFSTSIDNIEATVSVFLLGYAISQLILGPVSDHLGRIPVLLGGLVLFTTASLMVALSSSVNELYLYRFLQALGGGASVTVFPYVNDYFNKKQSAQIISYIMAVVAIAPLVAPVIGGEVYVSLGWQWIFYGLTIYALLVISTTMMVLGSSTQIEKPLSNPLDSHSNTLAKIVGTYFDLLKSRTVMAHIFSGGFAFAGLFAFISGSPYVYIDYFGVAEDHYGYFVAANTAMMILFNVINARYLHNFQPTHKMIIASVLLGVISVILLIASMLNPSLIFVTITTASFIGLLGLISANAIAGALSSNNENSGSVSALYGVIQFTLGAFSSAVISILVSDDASNLLMVIGISGLLSLTSALSLLRKLDFTPTPEEA